MPSLSLSSQLKEKWDIGKNILLRCNCVAIKSHIKGLQRVNGLFNATEEIEYIAM